MQHPPGALEYFSAFFRGGGGSFYYVVAFQYSGLEAESVCT